ncbi:SRPBCC family protein [Nonomuraea sp. NPDC049784]|uniref:SRPBCC family protein n=1 Tax=Nonomuraea sp. NPDC049784 TaxID=3154361 RepID=UPI00340BE9D1
MFTIHPSTSPNQQSRPTTSRTVQPRTSVRAGALTISLAVAGVLGIAAPPAQAAPAQAPAAQHNSPSECRGEGVDTTALVRYRTSVVIDAPLSTIWKLQTDVEGWPSWQPPVTTIKRLDPGTLRKGSRFRWTTPAPATPTTPATTLTITSTVKQLKRNACILWSGPAIGEGLRIDEGVHLWTFTKVKGGVLVQTEETWTGAQVEADVPTATAALGSGLEAWLRDLKAAAEAQRPR